MCGIVGYVGKKGAAPILISGLKQLEYRGYDSAGFVIFNGAKIKFAKAKGKVEELEKKVNKNWQGNIGIAHTRWATHGEPSEINAHPHTDCSGRVFVCHNGIIENYKELKEALIRRGHKFKSETDTEVLAHLIEENLRYGPEKAIARSLKYVKGTYGLSIVFADYSNKLFAAKNGSPLIIGLGKGENMVASDASAIVGLTKDVIYMRDGEMAVITDSNVCVLNISRFKNIDISGRKEKLHWDAQKAQKNGYPHFMLKEIFEQPESIANSFHGRLFKKDGVVDFEELENVKNKLQKVERFIITGCGSAYLAGSVGRLMIEELAGIPCEVDLASELRYRNSPIKNQNLAMVAVSQSGETADTLADLRYGKEKGILTIGIVNVVGSTIAREADAVIYNHAGPEIGVASTKGFSSELVIFALLGVFLGRNSGFLSAKRAKEIAGAISDLPKLCGHVLKDSKKVKKLAKQYKNFNNFLYIGRKYNFPIALEGALKLKEISYIHAEGYSAGEMKHGPIAMIDENLPTLAIAPIDSVYDKTVSNMEEIKARQGKIIAITTEGNEKIKHIADDWLYIPKTLEMLTPTLSAVVLQLFAYYMGMLKGVDIDKPRNLAKSVTVE